MKRTKIVATLGPAVESVVQMKALINAGCDIARINVAHGDISYHQKLINNFKKAAKDLNKNIAILLDIKGPEIRTGEVENGEIMLLPGSLVVLTTQRVIGNPNRLSVNFPLGPHLHPEDIILLDDGKIKLKVVKIENEDVTAKVICGGKIKSRRGVNVPKRHIPCPYLTQNDRLYLQLAAQEKVDLIAASFVRNAEDVYTVKKFLAELNADISIIAKIETHSAVRNIEDILLISDGIMVARGDLGVEMPVEDLPEVQKYLLKKATEHAKPAILATQILESMIKEPVPTRAEVSDIANGILDGADALMLSAETAVGKYPIETVRVLKKVAQRAEKLLFRLKSPELKGGISHNVSNAAVLLATEMEASAIVCITRSGKTARLVSKHRPKMPIIAATYNPKVLQQMCLLWGTKPLLIQKDNSTDKVIQNAIQRAISSNFIKKTDILVITAGEPKGISGTTNIIRVQIVGDILGRGVAFGKKAVKGHVSKYPLNRPKYEILVSKTQPDREAIFSSRAVIMETWTVNPEVIKEAVKEGIVIMIGVKDIFQRLNEGDFIYIDPQRGLIWK